MRNLKRALSLTLASVMLLGMMVVGTSALSFNDADKISNVTAASVLQDLGVMVGNDGNFMPEAPVSRAQMAKLVCLILYGSKLNVSQFSGTTQYTDVPANEWYNGYVNLASSLGIINGYGDGRFGPDDTVTTAQAALMLCRALGYFQGNEMTGNWGSDALTAITQATRLKLFGDLKLNTNELLSRDNVCEMVFNAMTVTVPVMYNKSFDIYYNDETSWVNGVVFSYDKTLGYKNYSLVYNPGADFDDYGRPVTVWGVGSLQTGWSDEDGNIKDGKATIAGRNEIAYVAEDPVAYYTAETSASDIQRDLRTYDIDTTGATIDNATLYVDGASITFPNWTDWANGSNDEFEILNKLTGNGTEVYIYANDAGKVNKVVVNHNYLAEVTKVKTDDDGRYVTLDVFEKSGLDKKNFYTENFAEGDYVQVTVAKGSDGKTYVASAKAVKSSEGAVTAIHTTDSYLRLDGEKIEYAADMTAALDDDKALALSDYKLFLDEFGYVLGYTRTGSAVEDYLFLVRDSVASVDGQQGRVVFTDGTSEVVSIKGNTTKYDGVYSYTVSDGKIYDLTAIDTTGQSAAKVENGKAKIVDNATGNTTYFVTNNSTAFVVVDSTDNVFTHYEGYSKVPSVSNTLVFAIDQNNDGVQDVVYAVDGTVSNSNATIFYVAKNNKFEEFKKDGTTYWKATAIYVDGVKDEDFVVDGTIKGQISAAGAYIVKSVNADGYVTALDQFDTTRDGNKDAASFPTANMKDGAKSATGGTLRLTDGLVVTYNDDTVFVYVDKDDAVSRGSVRDIELYTDDDATTVQVVKTKDDKWAAATHVIVLEKKPTGAVQDVANGTAGTADVLQITTPAGSLTDGTSTGEATVAVKGTVKADATSNHSGVFDVAPDASKWAVVELNLPDGTYGMRANNPAWGNKGGYNNNVVIKTVTSASSDTLKVLVGEGTIVTIEFDWDYDGTPANFAADYTLTLDCSGLVCN